MRYAIAVLALLSVAFAGFEMLVSGRDSESTPFAFAAEKGAGLEDFMLVVHGPKGLLKQIQESVGTAAPSDDKAWKSVKAEASIIAFLTESILEKSAPAKGDKASWKAKVGDYAKSVKALARSADDKDASAMKSELDKLKKSCESCHKAHR